MPFGPLTLCWFFLGVFGAMLLLATIDYIRFWKKMRRK